MGTYMSEMRGCQVLRALHNNDPGVDSVVYEWTDVEQVAEFDDAQLR